MTNIETNNIKAISQNLRNEWLTQNQITIIRELIAYEIKGAKKADQLRQRKQYDEMRKLRRAGLSTEQIFARIDKQNGYK